MHSQVESVYHEIHVQSEESDLLYKMKEIKVLIHVYTI